MKKETFIKKLNELLVSKRNELNEAIEDLQTDMSSDTKSTAGDKHETGREMMKQSLNKLADQRQMVELQIKQFEQLSISKKVKVSAGSLVKTNQGWFFFGLAFGKVEFDNQFIFALSMTAPISKAALNQKKGDEFAFRGVQYQILEIL